jgi:hypothetical protein
MKAFNEQNIVKPEINAPRIRFQIKNPITQGLGGWIGPCAGQNVFENRNFKK